METVSRDSLGSVSKNPFLLVGLLFYYLMLVLLSWFTSHGEGWWTWDFVDSFKILGIDDAYRYYSARSAFSGMDVYAWGYMQPLAVLFDGLLIKISGGSIFLARLFHGLGLVSIIFFVFRSMLMSGSTRAFAFFSAFIMLSMPAFFFVGLSFLSEFWLMLGLSLSAFLFLKKSYLALSVVLSMLPLFRPEGLFLMLPFSLFFLLKGSWRHVLICFIPGFIYGVFLLFYLDDPSDYYTWISEVRKALNQIENPDLYNYLGMFSAFNFFWLSLSLAGFLSPSLRRLWPLWFGGILVWVIRSVSIYLGFSFFEARYFLPLVPVLSISFASLMSAAYEKSGRVLVFCFLAIFSLYVAMDNLAQLDPVRSMTGWDRWPIKAAQPRSDSFSVQYDKEDFQEVASALEEVYSLSHRADVKYILIGDYWFFYFLDPEKIPTGVRVAFAPVIPANVSQPSSELLFLMHPGEKQYGNFKLSISSSGGGLEKAILVHEPFCSSCQAAFSGKRAAVYLFDYSVSP